MSLALNELAADARALLGVSHMIIYDQSLRDLSRLQLLALDTWLSAGGRMVDSRQSQLRALPGAGDQPLFAGAGQRHAAHRVHTGGQSKMKQLAAIADVWAQSFDAVQRQGA